MTSAAAAAKVSAGRELQVTRLSETNVEISALG
jgi:hypothetical protein